MKPSLELREKSYIGYYNSSEGAHRTFCGRCGTHFTYSWLDGMKEERKHWGSSFDIATGTLDK